MKFPNVHVGVSYPITLYSDSVNGRPMMSLSYEAAKELRDLLNLVLVEAKRMSPAGKEMVSKLLNGVPDET